MTAWFYTAPHVFTLWYSSPLLIETCSLSAIAAVTSQLLTGALVSQIS